MNLEFKDSDEETSQGKIKLRLQYVYDEQLLFGNLLKAYKERKELIEKCIQVLEEQKLAYYQTLTDSARVEEQNQDYDAASFHAGFYSLVESGSLVRSDSCRSPTMRKYVEKQSYIEDLCSYDLTQDLLKISTKQEEEEKAPQVPFSVRNEW